MPQFVIERQYLIPMYQHIVVEAENLEAACKKGLSDAASPPLRLPRPNSVLSGLPMMCAAACRSYASRPALS
jgi:hypothetical protein